MCPTVTIPAAYMKAPKNGDGKIFVNGKFCRRERGYDNFSDISRMVRYVESYWASESKYLRLRIDGMRDRSRVRRIRDAVSALILFVDC